MAGEPVTKLPRLFVGIGVALIMYAQERLWYAIIKIAYVSGVAGPEQYCIPTCTYMYVFTSAADRVHNEWFITYL